MTETFKQAKEGRQSSDGSGEYGLTIRPGGVAQSIEERFENLRSFLDFVPGDQEISIDRPRPNRPGEIDLGIDLQQLDVSDLLGLLIQVQFANLNTQLDILDEVSTPTSITVSGANVVDGADEPTSVVPTNDNTEIPTRTLYVRADPDNQDDLYFGDDDVDPLSGFLLTPGESIVIDVDLRDTVLYMASEDENAAVFLLGVI